MTSAPKHHRGYLLIELIAVVTLAAMAAAALIPALAGPSETVRRNALVNRLHNLDQRARAVSLRQGPVLLRADADHSALCVHDNQAEHLMHTAIDDAELYILDRETDQVIPGVLVDRLGRSADYRLLIRAGGKDTILRFDGMTGRMTLTSPTREAPR